MTTEQVEEKPPPSQDIDEGPSRFEVELEFVQSLANPQYVNFLAQNNYFNNEDFLRYLEYLEYFRTPEYAKFIIYPNCLAVLTLLKNQQFRNDIQRGDVAKALMDEMFYKWALGSTR